MLRAQSLARVIGGGAFSTLPLESELIARFFGAIFS
jgi:hypothetical protein